MLGSQILQIPGVVGSGMNSSNIKVDRFAKVDPFTKVDPCPDAYFFPLLARPIQKQTTHSTLRVLAICLKTLLTKAEPFTKVDPFTKVY